MMLLLLFLTAYVLSNTQAFTQKDANDYIDSVLRTNFVFEIFYSRLEPYNLPNIHVDSDNEANLVKGHLLNLGQVRRSGDCSEPLWQFANISFLCTLNFSNPLIINYTANVTYDDKQIVFYPNATVRSTEVAIQITTTKEENIPNMRMFSIRNIGSMTVISKMIGVDANVSNIVEPPIREVFAKESTTNLRNALYGRFKAALAFSIYKTPIPFFEEH